MVNAKQLPSGNDSNLESLVAYLDGELTGPAAVDVEQRLAHDQSFRDAKRQMEQAWALLGELPTNTTQLDLSNTTGRLTAILPRPVESTTKPSLEARGSGRHYKKWLVAILALASIVVIGAYQLYTWEATDQLVRDLPIVQNIELYQSIPDTDFLASIARDGYFAANVLGPNADAHDGDSATLENQSLEQRRAWLAALPPSDRTDLHDKQQLASQMTADDWSRARQLHAFLHGAGNAGQLQGTLRAYTAWLQDLPVAERSRYLTLPRAEQLKFLAETFGDPTQYAASAGLLVARTDAAVLRHWTETYIERHAEQLVNTLPPAIQQNWTRVTSQRQNLLLVGALVRGATPLAIVSDSELAAMTSALTPEARQALQTAGGRQRDVLARWLQRAWGLAGRTSVAPNAAQLRTFYQSLSPSQRAYLSTLEPDARRQVVAIMRQQRPAGSP